MGPLKNVPRAGCKTAWFRVLWLTASALLVLLLAVAQAGDLHCDACGRPIDGKYCAYKGLNLHEDCYLRLYAPRCAVCNAPIEGQYIVYEGKTLHRDCYLKRYANYCVICSRPIVDEYIRNWWGDVFCARHVDEYPACEFCGRLITDQLTGGGVHYVDGRQVCRRCYASAVMSVEDARPLIDSVKVILARQGIHPGLDFNLHLIDKTGMDRLTPSSDRDSWGYTELKRQPRMFGWFVQNRIDMYLLSGMPRVVFMRVAAHELMHVWLFEHAPLDMDHMLVEGSCEYAAYLVLRDMDDPLAHYDLETQRENRDLAYGAGFREVSGYVAGVGLDGWLSYLQAHSDPPW